MKTRTGHVRQIRPAYTRRFRFGAAPSGDVTSITEGPYDVPVETSDTIEPYTAISGRLFPFGLKRSDASGWMKDGPVRPVAGDTPKERFSTWARQFVRLAGESVSPPPEHKPHTIVGVTFDTEPYRACRASSPSFDAASALLRISDLFKAAPVMLTGPGHKLSSDRIEHIVADDDTAYPSHMPEAWLPVEKWPGTWILDAAALEQAVAAIDGTPPPPMVVGVGGSSARKGWYAVYPWLTLGIFAAKSGKLIAGGLLTGRAASASEGISPLERAVAVLPTEEKKSFLWWLKPAADRDSVSPTVLSWYMPWMRRKAIHANQGERRYCISCGYCRDVCPAGLDPELLWKSMTRGQRKIAEAHGLERCFGCNLCSYVCPSKIDIVRDLLEK